MYENEYTEERQAWFPDAAAEKVFLFIHGNLPFSSPVIVEGSLTS